MADLHFLYVVNVPNLKARY